MNYIITVVWGPYTFYQVLCKVIPQNSTQKHKTKNFAKPPNHFPQLSTVTENTNGSFDDPVPGKSQRRIPGIHLVLFSKSSAGQAGQKRHFPCPSCLIGKNCNWTTYVFANVDAGQNISGWQNENKACNDLIYGELIPHHKRWQTKMMT